MPEIQSSIHQALLDALTTILRPIVKLMLQSGVSYDEFNGIAKTVFVHVATEDYRRRGRPPNYSQVSAMTGISRREVSKIRDPDGARWTPNMETSPVNTLLHQWHFDADFSNGAGEPHALPFEGEKSFSTLVARHLGDTPPGAMRSTLLKAGVVTERTDGLLKVGRYFFFARRFDEDLVRGMAFSLASLASTLAHNAMIHRRLDLTSEEKRKAGRLERVAWSEHLGPESLAQLKNWVEDDAGPRFLHDVAWKLGQLELPIAARVTNRPRAAGVGLFYFEEE
jgi:hypothetical protein